MTSTRSDFEPRPAPLPKAVQAALPEALRRSLLELRHDLHRHPELSLQEHRTAERLEAALRPLRPAAVERVTETGIVARFAGRDRSAPVVAIRGDIDALPVHEDTGLAFASQNAGVMHACGHDVHATWAIGAAALLATEPAAGDVLVILQPAEEVGVGASQILDSGALDGVAAIFGAHVDRRFPVGQLVADDGPLAASSDLFEIDLIGSGAHGARPQESHDPIIGAAALVMALQTVVARRLDPSSPGVLSICSLHAGQAANVIPGDAQLKGTLRTTTPEVRQLLRDELEHITHSVAATHHLKAELRYTIGLPPVVNPPEITAWARQAAAELLGADNVVPFGLLNMAAEDFAFYQEKIPGTFLRIGAREPDGKVIPAHAPHFYAADESIFIGATVLAQAARVASAALAAR